MAIQSMGGGSTSKKKNPPDLWQYIGATKNPMRPDTGDPYKNVLANASGVYTPSSSGGGSQTGGGGGGGYTAPQPTRQEPAYDPAQNAYMRYIREQQRAEEARKRAAIDQGVNTLNAQKPLLEQNFQDAAQQAYIQLMQSRKSLPQLMSAQGLGGGLAESSLVDLDAGYGENVNSLLQQKNQGLSDIDRDIANLQATGDISLADTASAYAQKLQELALQQMQEQRAQAGRYNGVAASGPANRLKTLLSNPYVKRAQEAYDIQANPTAALDYLSNFITGEDLDTVIAYWGIPQGIVQQWLNGGGSNGAIRAGSNAALGMISGITR